ncbi:hypothetical protein [Duganella callida]|uniref:Uncharacterized protein n=1 Tax=Duganella callida TaxID=2561932 RepID=A0A4Y9S5R6_9BURK|nr:hypothetical protein [Duganella callida]TFW14838.1 hypothetical protein E4L98_27380 [Duganella callida]
MACRMAVSRRAEMGEAGFRHYLQILARQREHVAAVASAERAAKLQEGAENAAAWSALRARAELWMRVPRRTQSPSPLAAAPSSPTPLNLLLPSGPPRARPVSNSRRERYRTYLRQIVAEAGQGGQPPATGPVAAAVQASTLPGRLCGFCGGGCCTKGGEQAYLTAAGMRRLMAERPYLSADAVVDAYLAHVPDSPMAGSCINHTRQGCSLPRDMRSDICNRYACDSLQQLQAALSESAPVQTVLVVRRKQDHWHRAELRVDNAINGRAILREDGTRTVRAA